jgi:hypothetical protein
MLSKRRHQLLQISHLIPRKQEAPSVLCWEHMLVVYQQNTAILLSMMYLPNLLPLLVQETDLAYQL